MPALRLKLAGSLVAGGLAGVAALATLTSTSSPELTPTSDSSTTTQQQTVESPAPCPSGTVEKGDSCERTITVVTPAEQDDDVAPPAAPAQPVTAPVRPQPKPAVHESADDEQEPAEVSDSEDADEHESEDAQVEQEDHHSEDSATESEHESDD